MSGIGKGVSTSSIGTILSHYGYNVNLMKVDPYLNIDAGTMNPTEHGEVFVMDSGLETDQDIGNYERFLGKDLVSEDYLTSGMVYQRVLEKERNLGYKGKCIEAIPHIVDEIIDTITTSAEKSKAEVQLIEIGGTIGDYQNMLFLEAARRMLLKQPQDVLFVLVSFIPCPKTIGEVKTRPTQNAIRQLSSYGVNPNIIIARGEYPIDLKHKKKISNACNIPVDNIISAPDIESIYDVVLNFEKDGLGKTIQKELSLPKKKSKNSLTRWKSFSHAIKNNTKRKVNIGIIGKYFETGDYILGDAYISIIEAIKFSCVHGKVSPNIIWLSSKQFEGPQAKKALKKLDALDGLIIPGGFGSKGVEGKIDVITYARKNKIPILGICYGMQLMVVEFMRNVVGVKDAHTIEVMPKTKHPVVTVMEEQKELIKENKYGGSMRLGAYTAYVAPRSLLASLYKTKTIKERHRHRYEINSAYTCDFEDEGLRVSARTKNGLVEAIELDKKEHPYFVGSQFHPEFTARPFTPGPLFNGLIQAAKERESKRKKRA